MEMRNGRALFMKLNKKDNQITSVKYNFIKRNIKNGRRQTTHDSICWPIVTETKVYNKQQCAGTKSFLHIPFATLREKDTFPIARYTNIRGVQFAPIKIKEVYLFSESKI